MDEDDELQPYSLEEAQRVAVEHAKSPDVERAAPVTFMGKTHVHLDLRDGDVVIIGTNECLHIT